MATRMVDFEKVKVQVSMEQVLEYYGVLGDLARKGDSLTGRCPLHEGDGERQFRVSVAKRCWKCFGDCGGGNVIDFVAKKEGVSLKQAAVHIADWFRLEDVAYERSRGRVARGGAEPPTAEVVEEREGVSSTADTSVVGLLNATMTLQTALQRVKSGAADPADPAELVVIDVSTLRFLQTLMEDSRQ